MLLGGSIDLAAYAMTITGEPIFDIFFTLMVFLGIVALGLNAIFSFFDF